jgi:hypothetical protein
LVLALRMDLHASKPRVFNVFYCYYTQLKLNSILGEVKVALKLETT